MLGKLLSRLSGEGVTYLDATVTPSNTDSSRMFRRFADWVGAECREELMYETGHFPKDDHEEEWLLRIGPIDSKQLHVHAELPQGRNAGS